ncbi:MAG: NHL repeat-containing protein [Chloroflexi bacterium]|nr:NHL repeat-containing protein [Chloroflexota bacterium]
MTLANFTYSHTIGLASFEGRGFMNPVDMRFDSRRMLYVLSRSNAQNKDVRVSVTTLDADYQFEFGRWGTEPGKLTMPTALAIDGDDRVYVSDEHMNNVSVFDRDGKFILRWGEQGTGRGELNRPSGLAFDSEGNLHVVDHLNARVQKFTPDGQFLSSFGEPGAGTGQFSYPWGIAIDAADNIWVADWRNDRIQRFDRSGSFVAAHGRTGSKPGEFRRPAGIAVDERGDVYVADWENDRVQVFSPAMKHLETLWGDATLSKWCEEFLAVNPEQRDQRLASGIPGHEEKLMWRPSAVCTTRDGLVLIADSCRHRIQIYQRVLAPVPA